MKISDLKDYKVLPSSGGSGSGSAPEPQAKSGWQKTMDVGTGVANFFGAKGISEQFGADIARARAPEAEKGFVEYPKMKEVVGSAIQTGANLIPGVGKGVGMLGKTAAGLGAGYAFDVGSKLQDKNKATGEALTPGIGTAIGGGLPVAGAIIKPAAKIVGRLFKGLGSGLGGVSSENIERMVANPEFARKASDKLAKSGNNRMLEENAKTIISGVSKIRNEASSAYRSGLDKLSDVDIKPDKLKKGFFGALEKNKIAVGEGGKIDFANADFLDPKIQQKAESIINKINQQDDLTGTGVRKLMDMVDNSRFKSAPDGERQAFNAFVGDLKQGIKDGINASTDKLSKINAKYSADQQLAETVEDIFGSVNFKNLPEVVKASQKLEGLFAQKGLAPEVVDNFLSRIGVNPAEFKTAEAVRQISNKGMPANTKGLSLGEITQQVTSAIVTPTTIKNLSIATGMTKQKLIPFLRQMKKPARNIVIQALLSTNQDNSE